MSPRTLTIPATLFCVFVTSGFGNRSAAGQNAAQPPLMIAGIEIGGKSVKGVVVEVPKEATGGARKLYESKTVPTNITTNLEPVVDSDGKALIHPDGRPVFQFSKEAIARTAEAVATMRNDIQNALKQNDLKVVVVASSGVVGAVRRPAVEPAENPSLIALTSQVAAKSPGLPPLVLLDSGSEVRLTFLGVARGFVASAISVDIGSGNTKFGFAENSGADLWKTTSGEIPFGSNTFVEQAGGKDKGEWPAYKNWADGYQAETVLPALKKQLKDEFLGRDRDKIIYTGGIAWAMISLEKPDALSERLIPITEPMIRSFLERVRSGDPYKVKTAGEAAEKQARAVRAAFNPQQLLAGAEILEATWSGFNIEKNGRSAYFSSEGLFAWIMGYAAEKLPKAEDHDEAANLKESLDTLAARFRLLESQLQNGNEKVVDELTKGFDALIKKPGSNPPDLKEQLDGLRHEVVSGNQEIAKGFKTVVEALDKNVKSEQLDKLIDSINALGKQLIEMRKEDKSENTTMINKLTNIEKLLSKGPPDRQTRNWSNYQVAWTNFHKGLNLLEKRSLHDAMALLRTAIEFDDTEPAFWYALALSQYGVGEIDAARYSVSKVVHLREAFPQSLFSAPERHLFTRLQDGDRRGVELLVHDAETRIR